jgi:MoxR-like ATPase
MELGASPRASRHLLTAAKARAAAKGRRAAEIEDVKWLAPYVLSHRLNTEAADARQIVVEAMERALGASS